MVGDIVIIILGVSSRLFALHVVGIIRAHVVLETEFVIYVVSLDTSGDFALLYLRVIAVQKGQPHGIGLTLARLRVRKECKQEVLHLPLGVRRLLHVREVSLVDLILRLEFLL